MAIEVLALERDEQFAAGDVAGIGGYAAKGGIASRALRADGLCGLVQTHHHGRHTFSADFAASMSE